MEKLNIKTTAECLKTVKITRSTSSTLQHMRSNKKAISKALAIARDAYFEFEILISNGQRTQQNRPTCYLTYIRTTDYLDLLDPIA